LQVRAPRRGAVTPENVAKLVELPKSNDIYQF
jgi:hypothetical protein